MDNRKPLTIALISFMVLGVLISSIPFIKSLNPTATAGETLPKFDISKIKSGQFAYFDLESSTSAKLLVIRDYGRNVYAYYVFFDENKFILPDLRWGRHGPRCNNFSPTTYNDKLIKNGVIACQDKSFITEYGEWWNTESQWSYHGKNLGAHTEDMIKPKYTVERGYLILGKYKT